MKSMKISELYSGYRYGPADLTDIELGDGYVRLRLDRAGRAMSAVYRGCAYWSITPDVIGKHFSLVQELKAEKLTAPEYAHILSGLKKNGASPPALLQKWEADGYRFYLHSTNKRDIDYLVVARGMSIDD